MDTRKCIEIVDNVVRSKNKVTIKYNSFLKAVFEKLKENEQRISMIYCNTGKQWTSKEMLNAIYNLGTSFMDLGISKRDVVFFYCPNNDIHTVAMLALWAIGAITSGSLPNNPQREVENLIKVSGATYLIGCNDNIDICSNLMAQLKQLKSLFLIDDKDEEKSGLISIKSLLKINHDSKSISKFYEAMSEIKPDDVTKINFSSGTTGPPKAVLASNSCFLSSVVYPISELITNEDTVACIPHYCHAGRTQILAVALLQGSKLAVISEFESSSFIELVQKYSITASMLVSAAINLMNDSIENSIDNFPLQTVFVTGEALPKRVAKEYIKKFNPSYFGKLYGSTEMGIVSLKPKCDGTRDFVTNGIPTDGVCIKVVDTTTNEKLECNKVGEILMKGPQLSPGYFNNQTANEQNYDEDGFIKTGDQGYFDENGYIYLTDRIKETLKYNSQQVSPSELESILLSHDSVKEAVVIGVPDEIWGDLPKAFVVLKEDFKNKVTEEDLIEFVASQVADHKKLRGGLQFIDKMKKTVIGKIDRMTLKSL